MRKFVEVFYKIKAIQLALLAVISVKFDTSSEVFLNHHGYWVSALNNFVSWDAVYFTKLFSLEPTFEHEFVFSPLFTRLVRSIPLPAQVPSFYVKLVAGIVLSNGSHLAGCYVLCKLTTLFFAKKDKASLPFEEISSVFYALSVAGVFLTTCYSESTCALLTFLAIYLREKSLLYLQNGYKVQDLKRYLLSALCVAIAFNVRSNALLFGLLYVYDCLHFFRYLQWKQLFKALLAGNVVFLTLCHSIGSAYIEFCPQRGEWCFDTIPSLMFYAQSTYWNNGFLNYWTMNNLPNFAFMFPTLVLSCLAAFRYLGDAKTRPVAIVGAVYIVLNLFFWHVQIMNRIHTFLPLNYWYLADLYREKRGIANNYMTFSVVWICVQTSLFAMFLPPA